MIHAGTKIENFTKSEFPEDPHKYADQVLMRSIQIQRDVLGHAINPSKVQGALARLDNLGLVVSDYVEIFGEEPSKHDVFLNKKSTALDWFSGAGPFETYTKICMSGLWTGIGVYFDTYNNSGDADVMFHTDIGRPDQLMWYRVNGKYHYSHEDNFYNNLCWHLWMRTTGMVNSNQ